MHTQEERSNGALQSTQDLISNPGIKRTCTMTMTMCYRPCINMLYVVLAFDEVDLKVSLVKNNQQAYLIFARLAEYQYATSQLHWPG